MTRAFLETIGLLALPLRFVGFRGLFDYCRHAGALLHRSSVRIQVHPSVAMDVSINDPYWLAYVSRGRSYEPEIERVLELFGHEQVSFVDAGANHGYWSIFAARFPGWTVQAIEAGSLTFAKLCANVAMNGSKVKTIHLAVSQGTGDEVLFAVNEVFHAGAHVVRSGDAGDQQLERVRTTSIDELLKGEVAGTVILKLDVEGQELAALRGAERTLHGDTLILYEEHGSQVRCDATRFLLESGFTVWSLGAKSARRIGCVSDALGCLKRATVGYNFAATKNPRVCRTLTG